VKELLDPDDQCDVELRMTCPRIDSWPVTVPAAQLPT